MKIFILMALFITGLSASPMDSIYSPVYKIVKSKYPSYKQSAVTLFPFFTLPDTTETNIPKKKKRKFIANYLYDYWFYKDKKNDIHVILSMVSANKDIYRLFYYYKANKMHNWVEERPPLTVDLR